MKVAARLWLIGFCFFTGSFANAQLAPLTIDKIMRNPAWMGTQPANPFWEAGGARLWFSWNPEQFPSDSLYYWIAGATQPQKATLSEKQSVVFERELRYNSQRTAFAYIFKGNLYYRAAGMAKPLKVTETADYEAQVQFGAGDSVLYFLRNQNIFAWYPGSGRTVQMSNLQRGQADPGSPRKERGTDQEEWLKTDQLALFDVLSQRKEKRDAQERYSKAFAQTEAPKPVYYGDRNLNGLNLSADGRFIAFRLSRGGNSGKSTEVPDYVTETGYVQAIAARPKVGNNQGAIELWLYDRQLDTSYQVKTDNLPGIEEAPAFYTDYPATLEAWKTKKSKRVVQAGLPVWSPGGHFAVVMFTASDHKDLWLMWLDAKTGNLKLLSRQHNDAWIAGPGIGSLSSQGWIDNERFFYQSEETGYAHLYVANWATGQQTPLTTGNYEVQWVRLSADKKTFYLITNEVHPGEKHFYHLPVTGGKATRITSLEGGHEVELSPDEKRLAVLYSYFNKPPELYVMDNKPGATMRQITQKAMSAEFASYPWRKPDLVTFKATDGATVYARLYKPTQPHASKPAVIFVHGAGYLQNAHKWWSTYFREYMFHNLLADQGYHVLDIDYRGSAGYGAAWRTGIYRHMGGLDLQDHVDGARWLVENHGVNAGRIGIYGGSYGGFITLMALFTKPDVFAAGAALRPVTDWAHYNHGYTSNILNNPAEDSLAYRRSSPIYHAQGLKKPLLICHGMVDVNVHFQDVVRLQQRLIELGKDDWELAAYPVEDHGFVEPSSWTDEYKRIYRLFERVLKKP